jgi:hypothetical protein
MGRLELPTGGLRMRRIASPDVPEHVFRSKFVTGCVVMLPVVPRGGGQHGGQLDDDATALASGTIAAN